MPFIGNKPSAVPLSSADIPDSIITSAKILDATIANADIANSTIDLTAKVTGTLPTTKGGTGLAALGTVGQALVVNSGATALEFATVGATAGQVIQVLSAIDATTRSTTSGTYNLASSTLTITITPSSASNKVLTLLNVHISGGDRNVTLFRNSTNLMATGYLYTHYEGPGSYWNSFSILDSPSTTSSTVYQIRIKGGTSGYDCVINAPGTITSSITCLEIKG